jgi:hypothetical protein
VLRPLETGQWRIIGDCYVHGVMQGEALKSDAAEERNHEWFD